MNTHPYNKAYLDEIVETQGKLFSLVCDMKPAADIDDFIEKFMVSRTRGFLDRGDAYVSNLDKNDLYEYFCKVDNFRPLKGKNFGGFMYDWTGEFYAYYQWRYNIPSAQIIKNLPLNFMKAAYPGLHDLDLELAAEKIFEKNHKNL